MAQFYPGLQTLSDYYNYVKQSDSITRRDTIASLENENNIFQNKWIPTAAMHNPSLWQSIQYANSSAGIEYGELVFGLRAEFLILEEPPIKYSYDSFILLRDTGLVFYQDGLVIVKIDYDNIIAVYYNHDSMIINYNDNNAKKQVIVTGFVSEIIGNLFMESGCTITNDFEQSIYDSNYEEYNEG